jgi:hypothetical protein
MVGWLGYFHVAGCREIERVPMAEQHVRLRPSAQPAPPCVRRLQVGWQNDSSVTSLTTFVPRLEAGKERDLRVAVPSRRSASPLELVQVMRSRMRCSGASRRMRSANRAGRIEQRKLKRKTPCC